jgi:hypothetical protein
LVIPAWFIAVPGPNAVNVAAAWQLSHAAVVGTCVAGGIFTAATNVLPTAAAWQLAQALVIPVWFIGVPGPNALKLLAEWQLSHGALVGM